MQIVKTLFSLECTTDGSRLQTSSLPLVLAFIGNLAGRDLGDWYISVNGERALQVCDFLDLQSAPDIEPKPYRHLEKRQHERHDMRVQVTVLTGSRSFTTFSENISQGGLLLERSIPATMRTDSARVFLVTPKKDRVLEVKGRVTGNSQEQKRIAFVELEARALTEISSWIARPDMAPLKQKKAA